MASAVVYGSSSQLSSGRCRGAGVDGRDVGKGRRRSEQHDRCLEVLAPQRVGPDLREQRALRRGERGRYAGVDVAIRPQPSHGERGQVNGAIVRAVRPAPVRTLSKQQEADCPARRRAHLAGSRERLERESGAEDRRVVAWPIAEAAIDALVREERRGRAADRNGAGRVCKDLPGKKLAVRLVEGGDVGEARGEAGSGRLPQCHLRAQHLGGRLERRGQGRGSATIASVGVLLRGQPTRAVPRLGGKGRQHRERGRPHGGTTNRASFLARHRVPPALGSSELGPVSAGAHQGADSALLPPPAVRSARERHLRFPPPRECAMPSWRWGDKHSRAMTLAPPSRLKKVARRDMSGTEEHRCRRSRALLKCVSRGGRAPSTSELRQWMPTQTRASMTSFSASSKRSNVRCVCGDHGYLLVTVNVVSRSWKRRHGPSVPGSTRQCPPALHWDDRTFSGRAIGP